MNSKRLVIKENLGRCIKAASSIKKYPVNFYTFSFKSNGFDTKIERFNKFERSFFESFFVKALKVNFQNQLNKIHFVTHSTEFNFDQFEGLHSLRVNFNIVTKSDLTNLNKLIELMRSISDEVIGGEVYISEIKLDNLQDVIVRLFPISSMDDIMTFEDLSASNAFPSFYTKTLYDYILEPMKVIYFK